MIVCLIHKDTKVVEHRIVLDDLSQYIPEYFPDHELASDHNGDIGWIWTNNGWVDPSLPTEEERLAKLSSELRSKRNIRLDECDKYMVSDFPLSEEQRQAWVIYRQVLRDLPNQEGFPTEVVWPEKPN